MTQENRESKVVIATVVSNTDEYITLKSSEWGKVTVAKGKNWDGGICWNGDWRKGLIPGDKVDLLRSYRNTTTQTPDYGIYGLGSLLDSPVNKVETQKATKLSCQNQELKPLYDYQGRDGDTYVYVCSATGEKCARATKNFTEYRAFVKRMSDTNDSGRFFTVEANLCVEPTKCPVYDIAMQKIAEFAKDKIK